MAIDKILIVNSDQDLLTRLQNGLQKSGQFDILTATDGRQALNTIRINTISILITEIDLPTLDGLELLATLSRQYPNILSIITTSFAGDGLYKRDNNDTIFCYMNEPLDHIKLHDKIIRMLDSRDELHFKAGIYPSSLLPLIHLAQKSCLLELSAGRDKTGTFYFHKGLLKNALCQKLTGKAAVLKMMGWGPGKYRFKTLPEELPEVQDKANVDLTALIMKGTQYDSKNSQKEQQDHDNHPITPALSKF